MARMFPERPLRGSVSHGERKVFGALQDNLPDTWTALHGVPLLRPDRAGERFYDGEIDFLLCHPAHGLLVVEVKGGGIACDHAADRWTTTDLQGQTHYIKNPFEQARRNVYALHDELTENRLTRSYPFPIGFVVWFPDLRLEGRALGLATHYRELTLDADSLLDPAAPLLQAVRHAILQPAPAPPGANGAAALVKHFAPSWQVAVRLGTMLRDEEVALVEATRSQYRVLSQLRRRNRALICGAAGSGKTFLALEKARRLAGEGRSVLLMCYNVRLAEWLRAAVADLPAVEVFHYHGLCLEICRRARQPEPRPDPRTGNLDDFFRYELPQAMLEALPNASGRYDAVLVDEAQDFEGLWWLGIEELLADRDTGTFYIFYDDNQHLYGNRLEFPIQDAPLVLCENCRNTRTIHEEVMRHYVGDAPPEPIGPPGRSVEVTSVGRTESELKAVETVVRRLVGPDGIAPADLVMLTPRAQSQSQWKTGSPLAGLTLNWRSTEPTAAAGAAGMRSLSCATIHTFKGLESPVVIVTELDHAHASKLRQLEYVASSRAKSHLVIMRRES